MTDEEKKQKVVHLGPQFSVIRTPRSEWLEFFKKTAEMLDKFAVKLRLRPQR